MGCDSSHPIRFIEEIMSRKYWSQRKGLTAKFNLETLKIAFKSIIVAFTDKYYFQEYFGYFCVDAGEVSGKAGADIPNFMFRKLRRNLPWPIVDHLEKLSEDEFFDIVELFHDCISFPEEGFFHSYSGCGMHYSTFNQSKGQEEYRNEINEILCDYDQGYELSAKGEVQHLLSDGLRELTDATVPTAPNETKSINEKVGRAVSKYKDRHSSFADRKDAVRELADVLEYLRPSVKAGMLPKDENELFNIANNFAIRHNNENQKDGYSLPWLSWMFYLYLSTIHLILRIRKT